MRGRVAAVIELLFLLLPVAAASGWWIGRRVEPSRRSVASASHPAFLRGLNYLLDEQPDKAIDVFLELAEVDNDTVETHLALGSLFRRRGEADRAIRIHQNLIARNTLNAEQRGYALFELGQDYMRAGLLDRAELLFHELAEIGLQRERALRGLLDIYQQERDWAHCLEIAERLKPFSERPLDTEIAQYHCELAEEARRRADPAEAGRHLARALDVDPSACARPSSPVRWRWRRATRRRPWNSFSGSPTKARAMCPRSCRACCRPWPTWATAI